MADAMPPSERNGAIRHLLLVLSLLVLVVLAPVARTTDRRWLVPAWFYPQALCVHSGWHYAPVRHARGADYVFGPGRAFKRTWDVPDRVAGGSGEGAWDTVNSYGGGMQFTLGTWHRAGGWARSVSDIARASPAEQIYRSYRIVVGQDRGSWREWPQTSRACGLR